MPFPFAGSTESAMRAAYKAIHDRGITAEEGFVGDTAEETIHNLSEISRKGMIGTDFTMLGIMKAK